MPRIDPPVIRPQAMGDIVIGGPSGSPIILPIGNEGDVLKVNGASPTWITEARNYTGDEIDSLLSQYSQVGHHHPIAEVDGLEIALLDKASSDHTHPATEIEGIGGYVDNSVANALVTLGPETVGAAPAVHTHPITDLQTTGTPTADNFLKGDGSWGLPSVASVSWESVTGKPVVFAPDAHTHPISEIVSLQGALDGKSAVGHGHVIADVSNLQATLDGKAATVHGHTISQITSLQGALDGKAALSHTHTIADITSLQPALNAKAPVTHTHGISDVNALQATLDGKAPLDHTQAISTITGLQDALDGKAAVSHTQAISTITGLQDALDGKSPTAHNHDSAYAPLSQSQTIRIMYASPDGISNAYDSAPNADTVFFRGGLKNVSTVPAYLVIEVAYAGTGSAKTASRSDHTHSNYAASTHTHTLTSAFPLNKTVSSGTAVNFRVGPSNAHAAIGAPFIGSGPVHDTGVRLTTDEAWGYVLSGSRGFCWVPAGIIS